MGNCSGRHITKYERESDWFSLFDIQSNENSSFKVINVLQVLRQVMDET